MRSRGVPVASGDANDEMENHAVSTISSLPLLEARAPRLRTMTSYTSYQRFLTGGRSTQGAGIDQLSAISYRLSGFKTGSMQLFLLTADS